MPGFVAWILRQVLPLLLGLLIFATFTAFSNTAVATVTTGCISHRPQYLEGKFEVQYEPGCTGHDEPEFDPVSNAPGSAKDLTWTVVLPSDGTFPVSATGPTFWFGGTVTDPKSLFGQAFVELQFYPDAKVTQCTSNGGFQVEYAPNTYSACSPVWKLIQGQNNTFREPAAFNAMLTDGTGPSNPLVMHAGDVITVHWFTTAAKDGFHVRVSDQTTHGSGEIVLNSAKDGPLMPAYDTQSIGNALGWGIVNDTPNSFVWEIGHTSPFTPKPDKFCLPGQKICLSYDAPAWAGTSPIDIVSVSFGGGSQAKEFAVASDFGGKAEINQNCASYGGPFCVYPWYTQGAYGFHYGVNFPDNVRSFGKADQFAQTTLCGGPFGPNSTYCDNIILK